MILSKKYKEELNKIVMNEEMKKRILNNVLDENRQTKIKKYPLKRIYIQIAVACFLFVICFSGAKNFIQKNKSLPKQISQNTDDKSTDDKNKDLHNKEQNKNNYSKENNSSVQEYKNSEQQNLEQRNLERHSNIDTNELEKNTDIKTKKDVKNSDNVENNKGITQEKVAPKDTEKEDTHESCVVSGMNPIKEYKTIEEAEEAAKFKINTIKALPNKFNINNISVISSTIIQIEYNNEEDTIDFRACKSDCDTSGDYSKYEFEKNLKLNNEYIKLKGHTEEKVNIALWQIGDISYSLSVPKGIEEEKLSEMIKSSF